MSISQVSKFSASTSVMPGGKPSWSYSSNEESASTMLYSRYRARSNRAVAAEVAKSREEVAHVWS